MDLHSTLNDLLARVPGALGAVLADWEGEAVETASRMDDYQLRVNGAHQGVILEHLRSAVRRVGDRLQEIVITTDRSLTLVLPITEEYFLVVFLSREAALGLALLEARRCIARLLPEIA